MCGGSGFGGAGPEVVATEGPNAIIQFRRDVAATLLRLVQDLSKYCYNTCTVHHFHWLLGTKIFTHVI